jgi:glucose-6-phosphate 1-dehydrogenase
MQETRRESVIRLRGAPQTFKYAVDGGPAMQPCILVIFGATGDLAKRKLLPALYKLHERGMPSVTRIIAVGRRPLDDAAIRRDLAEFITDKKEWEAFSQRITYHQLEFDDKAAYDRLRERLETYDKSLAARRVFYLATAPESFATISRNLSAASIASRRPQRGWHRVIFEKPFGHDLATAKALNKVISKIFSEQQIYRIDHYLGKELVQNILVLRFTNSIFEHLWHKEYIDNVQIIVGERVGVGSRGGYYDNAGALRDMVQNHLMQLIALTTMELPKRMEADSIRTAKVKVLKRIVREPPAKIRKHLILGQYTEGMIDGKPCPAYRDEQGIPKKSTTETFAALKLFINDERWRGVPFYLRTGKALHHQYAEIVVTFKQAPCRLFCGPDGTLAPNRLIIRIQPDEGVKVTFNIKEELADMSAIPVSMDFSHKAEFGINSQEAYERLLADVMRGDQTLFTRWDEVQEQWRIVDHLRKVKVPLERYAAGSHGPAAALRMIKKDGRDWSGNIPIK